LESSFLKFSCTFLSERGSIESSAIFPFVFFSADRRKLSKLSRLRKIRKKACNLSFNGFSPSSRDFPYKYNAIIGAIVPNFQEKDLSDAYFSQISEKLRQDALALLPTETILGLFCIADSPFAKEKLYQFKQRDTEKKLAYYVNSAEQIEAICGFSPPHLEILVKKFLPGPLTLIYEKGNETLGFRMSARKSLQKIVKHLKKPLLGTSANLSGQPACLTLASFQKSFGEKQAEVAIQIEPDIDIKPENRASTVALIRENEIKILREGSISEKQLAIL
jgi:L-threonylcarbamoyladenylate synthase